MVPFRKRLAYSSSQVGINLLWQSFNTVAVFYYVSDLQVSATKISLGMILCGIVNAFMNLLAGQLSDQTNTKYGRRIPYILFGTLPFVILFYLLFHPLVHGKGALLVYFFVVTLLFDLFFTFTALNIGALYPEMYRSQKERSSVSALQQFFGIFGLIIGVALSKSVGQLLGWSAMALIFGIISGISLYVSLYGSFENPVYREAPMHFSEAVRQTFRSHLFILYVIASLLMQLTTTMFVTLSSFYTKYVISLTATQSSLFLGSIFIVAIPFSFVWAKVASRRSNILATMMATVAFAAVSLGFYFDTTPLSVIVTGAFLGIGVSGFMVLLNMLLADVIDVDERVTGKRREGMYLGMNGLIVRIGMSLQYAILGIFFAVTHFNANAQWQPHATIQGFRFLVSGLPLILLSFSFLLLQRYKTNYLGRTRS